MWVAIHKCMEAILGIFLHSYLYLKLAKTICIYYHLCFCFNKIGEQVLPGQGEEKGRRRGEVAQRMYTHVSKCKSDKMKKGKKRIKFKA
jgi:hypothetical protein